MKREKQLLLDEMREQMERSGSFIVAQYQKLTGARAYEFRRQLAAAGGYFEVVRKRMFLQVARSLNLGFSEDLLDGHIGLVLGAADLIEATKVVSRFSNENDSSFVLLAGYIDGQKVDKVDVARLVTLPGKDQMRAELLGLLDAPAAGVLGAMEALLSGVVHCVDSRAKE